MEQNISAYVNSVRYENWQLQWSFIYGKCLELTRLQTNVAAAETVTRTGRHVIAKYPVAAVQRAT